MKTVKKYLKWIIPVAIGVAIGWVVKPSEDGANETDHKHEIVNEEWTCSMHPNILRSEPGQCPICGMDLIKKSSSENTELLNLVSLSPTAIKLAEIRTTRLTSSNTDYTISVNGDIVENENKVFSQTSHIQGRIEESYVKFEGEYVKKGQKIAAIYSPELVTAQEELFDAYKLRDKYPDLFEASKEKLRRWKFTDSQIDILLADGKINTKQPILSNHSGFISNLTVNQGDHVSKGQPLYQIVDLTDVWVLFDVFESDIDKVNLGDKVKFKVKSIPGNLFEGKIDWISPKLSKQNKTAQIRVEVRNPNLQLKPSMVADGIIYSKNNTEAILIPKTAVLWTGKRSIVYVKSNEGNGYMLREVTLGNSSGNSYEIKSGLQTGEEIVINGAFTIDAAAQLQNKESMMNNKEDNSDAFNHNQILNIKDNSSDKLKSVIELYMQLKDSLVRDNENGSLKLVSILNDELKNSGQKFEQVKKQVNVLSESGSIKGIRKNFKTLSEEVIQLVKAETVLGKDVFIQYCPMADNSKGAKWLSFETKVFNPYYGSKMLNCGDVVEKIKM